MGGGTNTSEAANAQKTAWSNLNDIFGISKTTAGTFGKKGTSATDAAQNYWMTLLTGNRQKLAEAVAPEANAMRSSADAVKRQEGAMGTARGGGTAAQNRELDDRTRTAIDTLVGRLRSGAAGALEGIGAQEISAMLSALGIGTSASGTLGGLAGQQVQANDQLTNDLWGAVIGAVGEIGGAAIGKWG